jgi:hypothetical protein
VDKRSASTIFAINSGGCAQLIHPTALFLPVILLIGKSKYPKT